MIKMLRYFLLLNFLFSGLHCADHDTFKNCSRISFCSSFRNYKPNEESKYAAEVSEFVLKDKILVIPLSNSKKRSLTLHLSLLEGFKFRVKITEQNNSRYELDGILVNEPEPLNLKSMIIKDDYISIGTREEDNDYTLTVTRGPPFTIEFYYKDQKELVLNGDRLVIENTETSQAFAFAVEFELATHLQGLFNHAYNVTLSESADGSQDPYRLRNSDTANYEVDSPMALYGSIPVVYGFSTSFTSGVFLHNAAEMWVDISYETNQPSAYFMVESGSFDLFIMLGPTPQEVVRQYTSLTGTAHMPQLWTLGYHQCRFTYTTQEEVKEVVANMDKQDFPMDAIWLDDGHSNGNRYFEWNPENFSDPIEMQKNISATGRKIVTILDPHIKVDDDYAVYAGAVGKYFVKWANGSDFEGDCWPGLSSWIDFLNPEASDYYASWYSFDKFRGTTETLAGVWNDMNEPAVFDDSLEKTLPFETVHYGGVPHRDVHNIYGFLQTKSTHQGLMQRDNGTKRPFILTRSHFAGSQRYAAMWTGDNTAEWPYLATSISQCLTANLLGMVWCGADVGGFFGNPNEELLQRWYQAAIWLPFFRGHSNKGTNRREPYLFSEDVQDVIRNAIKIRYKHIPVWYTLFYEHTRYGDPVIRPLHYFYLTYTDLDSHLMLGENILIRPVLEPNMTRVTVNFPQNFKKEFWYRVDDDSWKVHNGGTKSDEIVDINLAPLFYRGGSIIARRERARSTTEHMMDDPFTLFVNGDSIGMAEGRLYVDDYTSFEYSNSKSYFYVTLTYLRESHGIQISEIDGNSTNMTVFIQQIIVHTMETTLEEKYTTTSDGTPLINIDIVKHLNMRSGGFTLYL